MYPGRRVSCPKSLTRYGPWAAGWYARFEAAVGSGLKTLHLPVSDLTLCCGQSLFSLFTSLSSLYLGRTKWRRLKNLRCAELASEAQQDSPTCQSGMQRIYRHYSMELLCFVLRGRTPAGLPTAGLAAWKSQKIPTQISGRTLWSSTSVAHPLKHFPDVWRCCIHLLYVQV